MSVSLEGVAPTKKKSVPVIAVATTAGTAAETTINYVITDEKNAASSFALTRMISRLSLLLIRI